VPVTAQEPVDLSAPVTRDMRGGEAHAYRLRLDAGEYVNVAVEQDGIDVAVALVGLDGKAVYEIDSPNGSKGLEPVYYIAEAAGDYRLEVRSLEQASEPGRYHVRIADRHAATDRDRQRIVAVKLYLEGEALQFEQRGSSYRAALEKYLASRDAWKLVGEPEGETQALAAVVDMQNVLGMYPEARAAGVELLALAGRTGEREHEALACNLLTLITINQGDLPKAIEYGTRSVELSKAANNVVNMGSTVHNLGRTYVLYGETPKGIALYEEALTYRRQAADARDMATTLNAIGEAYNRMADYQKALEHYEQAEVLIKDGPPTGTLVSVLSNIGSVYRIIGELGKARSYHERALELARKIGSPIGIANGLSNMASLLAVEGRLEASRDAFAEAQQIFERIGARERLVNALAIRSIFLRQLGDVPGAVRAAETALELSSGIESRSAALEAMRQGADAHLLAGDAARARALSAQALDLMLSLGAKPESWAPLGLARADLQLGNLDEARTNAERAIAIFESEPLPTRDDIRVETVSRAALHYGTYAAILLALDARDPSKGYAAQAFQAAERARSRGLLESLALDAERVRQGVDVGLLARERETRLALTAKVDYKVRLLSLNASKELVVAAQREIDALDAEYQAARARVREASPAYAALVRPEPLAVEAVQRALLDSDTVLVEYLLDEPRSWVWAVTSKGFVSAPLPGRAEIEAKVRHVRELLVARACVHATEVEDERAARIRRADAEYMTAARELSDAVLAPVAKQIAGKRLAIVADGALQLIPFDALPEPGAADLLVVGHEVVMLPSATALATSRREVASRPPAAGAVAVLADPVFDATDERVKRADASAPITRRRPVPRVLGEGCEEREGFARLAGSRAEAEAIGRLAPKGKSLVALDFEATRDLATGGKLAEFRIVHFATHGYVPSESPELSGLVLSLVDETGAERAGYLSLADIYNLRLPAETVVLSACETGLGRQVRGEGIAGLTRGFMYAGSRRVVASLWKVDDRPTSELMTRLYQRMLKDGKAPARALREAKLELIRGGGAAPYYWAAFQLYGEWR
jgi:CHAT domain-containing protein